MSPQEVWSTAEYTMFLSSTWLGLGAWSNCGLGVDAAAGTLAPHATVLAGLACGVTVPVCVGGFVEAGDEVVGAGVGLAAVALVSWRLRIVTPRAITRMPAIARHAEGHRPAARRTLPLLAPALSTFGEMALSRLARHGAPGYPTPRAS
jgi:hypothetical protein